MEMGLFPICALFYILCPFHSLVKAIYEWSLKMISCSSTKTTCTFDATAVGSCNLVQYGGDLPPIYQNFDQVPGVSAKEISQVRKYHVCNYFYFS